MRLCLLFPLLLLAFSAIPASARSPLRWGPQGHWAVGAIARRLLTPEAQNACANILPSEVKGDIAAVASWADSYARQAYPWSAQLHYIDTPDWACHYEPSRDCWGENRETMACADGAIQNFTTQLGKGTGSSQQLSEALMFLVHIVGDIHQPLHVSFLSDQGGNLQVGTFCGRQGRRLHQLWDEDLPLRRLDKDFHGEQAYWVDYLVKQITDGVYAANVSSWQRCDPATAQPFEACSREWAQASAMHACNAGYRDTDGKPVQSGFNLCDDYYRRAVPIIDEAVAKAGVRLANVLNNLFRKGSPVERFIVAPEEFEREGKIAME